MVLERALLRLQSHVCGGAEHVPEASLRHDGLATLADSILASPPVERGESKARPSLLLTLTLTLTLALTLTLTCRIQPSRPRG